MAKVCAVNGCDSKDDLHEHHITPVVYDPSGRRKVNVKINRLFDPSKPLGECGFTEVFSYMFRLGCITEKDTITLCAYHHNVMHGIIKFNKTQHSNMVKEGIEKARKSGVRMGRPPSVTNETKKLICEMYQNGAKKKNIAKTLRVGCGTVYATLIHAGLLREVNG